MKRVKQIMLVCTGNACRSPMAEGLLRQIIGQRAEISVVSAGTAACVGMQATPEAIAAVRELGVDISRHVARQVNRQATDQASLIIAMTQAQSRWLKQHFPENQEKILTLGELACRDASLEIEDPIGGPLELYRQTAGQLQRLLQEAYQPMLQRLYIRENRTEGKA